MLTKQQQEDGQRRKQELQEEPEDEEDGGAQRTLASKEVDEQFDLLEADQVSCGVLYGQVRSQRTGQEIANVITSVDSRTLVGMPESVVGKINQRIGNVTTEKNSSAAVGVFSGSVDMSGFFKK